MEYVVMLETEGVRVFLQFIHQKGTDNAHGVFLRGECQSIRPSGRIKGLIVCSLVEYLTTTFLRTEEAECFILLQLLSYSGFV